LNADGCSRRPSRKSRKARAHLRIGLKEANLMRSFALALAFIWTACAFAQAKYPITVKGERAGRGAVVHAANEGPIPISVVVTFPEFENLQSSESLPIVLVVPPHTTRGVTAVTPVDPKKRWSYKLRYRYRYGSYTAGHDPAAMYRVPWLDGRTFVIGQAPGGRIVTHTTPASREAVDIPMPVGTPILAARGGVVFQTIAENDSGGIDEIYRTKANVVRVLHGDGTVGNYVHLMHEGVAVKYGEQVEAGKLIGYAGSTGMSSGPHLHFAVTRVVREGDELSEVSEPFRFYVGNPPRLFTPQSGLVVKADYSSPGIEPQVLRRRRPDPASAPAPSVR
jgi:murein DD-endopeptidase MepM/ murein hydrolase activator NlpD